MLCKQKWQARINQGCVSYLSAIFPSERMPLWTNILLFSYRKLNNPLPLVRLSATQMKLTDLCKCLYTIRLGARFSFLNFPLKKCLFFFFFELCQNSFAVPLRWVDLFFLFFFFLLRSPPVMVVYLVNAQRWTNELLGNSLRPKVSKMTL